MYNRGNQLDDITMIDVLQAPGLLARASILVVAARGIQLLQLPNTTDTLKLSMREPLP